MTGRGADGRRTGRGAGGRMTGAVGSRMAGAVGSRRTGCGTARRALFITGTLLALSALWVVFFYADLSPKVESDFFFSTEDPQMQTSRRIAELFPAGEQILISATAADLMDETFLERLRAVSDELAAVPGVGSVQSLTRGPSTPQSVAQSPFWSRLLVGEGGRRTLIVISLTADEGLADQPVADRPMADRPAADQEVAGQEVAGQEVAGQEVADQEVAGQEVASQARRVVEQVEQIVARHDRASFALDVSGVPWVVEQIRRALGRDLRVFSLASLLVFALVITLVYRRPWVIVGTLATCLGACALSLAALWVIGAPIGLLTANIVTIVFVLTLSHIVFLTANWARSHGADDPVGEGLRLTLGASAGCALTTLLGFASLLFASAKPLRELGLAGAVGTAVALFLAFSLYPGFLARAGSRAPAGGAGSGAWLSRLQLPVTCVLVVAVSVSAFGLPRLDTDPHLLSYFDAGSELRRGLERIDRSGGSSPLLIVVGAPGDRPLVAAPAQEKMQRLHAAFEQDREVGTALSLPILIAEAKRVPMAMFIGTERLVDILDSAQFDHVARSFVTEDRTRALYFLRMREVERGGPRRAAIERQVERVAEAGLELEAVGGLYELQASLGELVTSSVVRGLSGLLALFIVVAAWAARSARVSAAMIVCLASVPILVLGLFGHFGQPLDLISSPAANVAIALGIDSMIHLVVAYRRRRRAGESVAGAWAGARAALWPAVLGAAAILAAGFGIFSLSSFPPTRRFGVAVALGTAAAAALALLVMPLLSGERRGAAD